jgi:hypothetical protein
MDLLNDPWVIGIGGGILSGLIVTAVSRFVLSKRENREYLQKVFSANRELIYSIRPGISEGVIPAPEVIESLIIATARKFGVESRDVYGPPELVQELLKEVMDSSFISAKTKEDYCTKLAALAERPQSLETQAEVSVEAPEVRATIERVRSETIAEYRQRTTTMMSVMMGALAAVMTGLFAIFAEVKTGDLAKGTPMPLDELLKRAPVLLPTLLSVVTVVVTMWFLMTYRDLTRRRTSRAREGENERIDKSTASEQSAKESG